MAGLSANIPTPIEINLNRAARVLTVAFDDDSRFEFSCEYLRVFSPSAEVRGHGSGQEVLQTGKKNVQITAIEPIGNYAVRLVFDDGHNSGLYSWDYFYDLGQKQEANWADYLNRLASAGAARE